MDFTPSTSYTVRSFSRQLKVLASVCSTVSGGRDEPVSLLNRSMVLLIEIVGWTLLIFTPQPGKKKVWINYGTTQGQETPVILSLAITPLNHH